MVTVSPSTFVMSKNVPISSFVVYGAIRAESERIVSFVSPTVDSLTVRLITCILSSNPKPKEALYFSPSTVNGRQKV